MLIGPHRHVKRVLDGRHRALDLHLHAVARAADHGQAVLLREHKHSVVVFLARAEALGKLVRRQELVIDSAVRIVKFFQKGLQPCRIAQRQDDIELHNLVFGQTADGSRLISANGITHVMR